MYPSSWYPVGPARELRVRPWSRVVAGQRLVFYRTAEGSPVAMDARCAHQGADLGRGTVEGDRIRCPFHGWEYGPDGRCQRIPSTKNIPDFACQRHFPLTERWGWLFCFSGDEPLFPLPAFTRNDLVPGRPFVFAGDWPWYLVVANGFDAQHLRTVHGRRLLEEPRIDSPGDLVRRVRYHTEICGNSFTDRLIRLSAGATAQISITVWGGTLVLVEASFARARSFILITVEPLSPDQTRLTVLSLARQSRNPLHPLALEIRRWLTIAFMGKDLEQLEGVQYRPERLIETDALLVGFLRWLTDLPETQTRHGPSAPARDRSTVGIIT